MRTPEHRAHPQRVGKRLETEPEMQYLSPGAFTVLPMDVERLPDPPPAPPPYRLPTTTKRFKHPAFAIIGEVPSSNPTSRSPSPTGRVSPFRGHGFNPTGSRHASPSTSPIPRNRSPSPSKKNSSGSKIPKLNGTRKSRKSSTGALFGEKVTHEGLLRKQGSQSMSSLDDRQLTPMKPPASPRKKFNKAAFKQLSPIQGSSPEPSQNSPARTKSRSTPPSRFTSPTRDGGPKVPTRSRSRPNLSKSIGNGTSPLDSPLKTPKHNTKYQHVQSKIDSYHKPKPRQLESSEPSDDSGGSPKKKVLSRKTSFTKTSSRPNLLPKTGTGNKNRPNNYSDSSASETVDSSRGKTTLKDTKSPFKSKNLTQPAKIVQETPKKAADTKNNKSSPVSETSKFESKQEKFESKQEKFEPKQEKYNGSNEKSLGSHRGNSKSNLVDGEETMPTTLDVVASTTNTVAQPLKIETPKLGRTKPVSPMIDGRVLSATSVSQAINKMNDTVLNTQTLIKDSGLPNRYQTPHTTSAAVVTKTTEEDKKEIPKHHQEDTKKVDSISSKPQQIESKPSGMNNQKQEDNIKTAMVGAPNNINSTPLEMPPPHNNHVSSIGLGTAKAIEKEVQNNMSRLVGSMDSLSSSTTPTNNHKISVNDRIREARTVIAADVKPIKITVKEKPSEIEVQSGNVGPHFGVANGVNERPSLPPAQHQQQQQSSNEDASKGEPPDTSKCKRFLNSCAKVFTCGACIALCCKCCEKCSKSPQSEHLEDSKGCCSCFERLTQKCKRSSRDQVRINIQDENESTSLWRKLCCSSCCKRNKVGDSESCFPLGRRKRSWSSGRADDSFTDERQEEKSKCCSKQGCKDFFRKIFCCCCRKKEEPLPAAPRKESMVSSKKKSLTPTSVPAPEDTKPKLDPSLVEHNSHMKAAIPVLPVWLAWFCCVMNCILPGSGTVLSGLFCLCIGKPRFSQNDGPRPRIGSFIINLIIGFSQFFTVLFCLVGWGWSIWWGVIMVKIARKYRKLKHLEKLEETAAKPHSLAGQHKRDLERGKI
ncbi:hypothetical protein ABEB36_001347 [Hypothenemus hampei]|uniref:Protein stum n=1 Tax=Hypothenemus hampei TaxID=57062 RepID=A0ABD1FE92_HYPHA